MNRLFSVLSGLALMACASGCCCDWCSPCCRPACGPTCPPAYGTHPAGAYLGNPVTTTTMMPAAYYGAPVATAAVVPIESLPTY
jgi:hypothetical protein